jgi:hypothetical protein
MTTPVAMVVAVLVRRLYVSVLMPVAGFGWMVRNGQTAEVVAPALAMV